MNNIKSPFLLCGLNIFFNYSDCFMQIAEFIFHFSPAGKQTVSVMIRKNNSKKKTGENNLTTICKDSHLDLTFLWLEPKQFKRLTNRKTPILANLRIKYQEKIQRATCTVFFNWMCLRTLSDYCDVFNTKRARSCSRKLKWLPIPEKILFWVQNMEPLFLTNQMFRWKCRNL